MIADLIQRKRQEEQLRILNAERRAWAEKEAFRQDAHGFVAYTWAGDYWFELSEYLAEPQPEPKTGPQAGTYSIVYRFNTAPVQLAPFTVEVWGHNNSKNLFHAVRIHQRSAVEMNVETTLIEAAKSYVYYVTSTSEQFYAEPYDDQDISEQHALLMTVNPDAATKWMASRTTRIARAQAQAQAEASFKQAYAAWYAQARVIGKANQAIFDAYKASVQPATMIQISVAGADEEAGIERYETLGIDEDHKHWLVVNYNRIEKWEFPGILGIRLPEVIQPGDHTPFYRAYFQHIDTYGVNDSVFILAGTDWREEENKLMQQMTPLPDVPTSDSLTWPNCNIIKRQVITEAGDEYQEDIPF